MRFKLAFCCKLMKTNQTIKIRRGVLMLFLLIMMAVFLQQDNTNLLFFLIGIIKIIICFLQFVLIFER